MRAEGQAYSCSCRRDRVANEVAKACEDRVGAFKPGEHRAITNKTTGELFTYYFDPDTNVGEKYNMSRGFVYTTDKAIVTRRKVEVPGYDEYREGFSICDKFNKGLHDIAWPFRRGGRNTPGEAGSINDFLQAGIIKNTLTAYLAINKIDPKTIKIHDQIAELAYEMHTYSVALVTPHKFM